MAGSATVNFNAIIAGLPLGQLGITPAALASANANGQVQEPVLANGDNTITVPSVPPPIGVLIIMNPANTQAMVLKGVGADTGIKIAKTGWLWLPFDTTNLPASLVLNSAAAQTGLPTYIAFI